jgi:hypothetical protein
MFNQQTEDAKNAAKRRNWRRCSSVRFSAQAGAKAQRIIFRSLSPEASVRTWPRPLGGIYIMPHWLTGLRFQAFPALFQALKSVENELAKMSALLFCSNIRVKC